jgi:hypothetical protein
VPVAAENVSTPLVSTNAAVLGVASVGAALREIVTVEPVAAVAGPVLPAASVAPPLAKRGITVPSEQPEIVTVRVLPESVPGSKVQSVAVPVVVKLAAVTPVTDSENVSVYVSVSAPVGVAVTAVKLDTVGAVVSITIALEPAMLFAPVGTVVDVIALPAVSATVPIVKLDTVRSDEVSPAPTVYVPVSDVPADAAVNTTSAPVSNITVNVSPD